MLLHVSRRFGLALGPLLMLLSSAAALAQDGGPVVSQQDAGTLTDVVRELGPFGALAWGAYLLGGAVKGFSDVVGQVLKDGIPLRVELSEEDRKVFEGIAAKRPRAVG